MLIRNKVILLILFCAVALSCSKDGKSNAPSGIESDTATTLKIYKTPTCGCCAEWVEHINNSGFKTNVEDMDSLSEIKQKYLADPRLQSCHTAITSEGYVFEGHVPAKFIKLFLTNPPAGAKGLTVPGMPIGSPGMEINNRFDPYQVLLVKKDGSTEVFAEVKTYQAQF